MKKRIEYLDAIKGLAIILMVMGHTIAWNYSDWNKVCLFDMSQPTNYKVGGFVWQLIYSFHMALFFMVSGYLSGEKWNLENSIWNFFLKKTRRLFVPYLVTGFLVYIVRGHWGYWFFLCLYELSLIWLGMNLLLSKVNVKQNLYVDVLFMGGVYIGFRALVMFVPITIFGISLDMFVKYFVPFCFGTLMCRHPQIIEYIKTNFCYSMCMILFIALFMTRYITEYPVIFKIVEKLDFFLSVSALLACIVVFNIFLNGLPKFFERVMAYMGRLSMPIYILHILFVIQIPVVGNFYLSQGNVTSIILQIIYSVVVSSIAIVLSAVTYKILRRSSLLSLLMFGE